MTTISGESPNQWPGDTAGTELPGYTECYGFFKAYSSGDASPPIWLTPYHRPVNVELSGVYGFPSIGGSYVAMPAAITRGPITRTKDPRDTTCEITLDGLAGSHQFLLKAINNNYIVVVVMQKVDDCVPGMNLIIGEGVPTTYDGTGLSILVREDYRILDRLLPDVVYQRMCNNILFGRRCGLPWNLVCVTLPYAELTAYGSNYSWSTPTATILGHPVLESYRPYHFWLGQVVIGSWESRERRLINWCEGPAFAFSPPFERQIGPNENVIIAPGCDKTITTCRDVYGNQNNFFGFPELPIKNPATQGMF